jgi:hypothetical protein
MPAFYKKGRSPLEVVTEVIAHARALENRPDNRARFIQQDEDLNLWRLKKYQLEEVSTFASELNPQDWPSVTLNGPRTLWHAVRRAATSNDPQFSISLAALDPSDLDVYEAQMKEVALHERFARGLWQAVDEQRIKRGQMRFQHQLAFDVAIRGGAVCRVWFDEDNEYPFSIQLWDPRTVVTEGGLNSLVFASHHYRMPLYDLRESWPAAKDLDRISADGEGLAEVYDVWWLQDGTVFNTVSSQGVVLKDPQEMPIDHLPIYLVRMAGPDVEAVYDQQGTTQRTLDAWETIYSANREIYRWMNRIASLYGIFLRDAAIGSKIVRGKSAPQDPAQVKRGLKPFGFLAGEDIQVENVAPVQMATEAQQFFAFMQGEEQRGGVPYSTFGNVPFALSGFAINQLQGALSLIVAPVIDAMQWVYRLCTDEAISQFKRRGSRRPIVIKGTGYRDGRRQLFMEEIKKAQLRDKYFLEVTIKPELPIDRLQNAQIAQAWTSIGVDPITILDEVLNLEDPAGILKRSVAWKILELETAQDFAREQAAREGAFPGPQGVPGVPVQANPPPEFTGAAAPGQGLQNGDVQNRRLRLERLLSQASGDQTALKNLLQGQPGYP